MASKRLVGSEPSLLVANDDVATRWRALIAHDGRLGTCDRLFDVLREVMSDAHLIDAPSAESARHLLRRTPVDVCFVCLDLPPTPSGGIKLAQELLRVGLPLILITRSLRWLPRSAADLRALPWIPPEAEAHEVVRAIDEAVVEVDFDNQVTLDSSEPDDDPDLFPSPLLSEV
ncbi:MAG: hypothetical protein R3B70_27180 [Polyangiaceae bacterium]